ncbi:hypothetical protein PQX77_020771 [Marasmius sp. AFHP31]|nr:hypothetical protein PQX77_020771 [Marasmius sp. AFHP31]
MTQSIPSADTTASSKEIPPYAPFANPTEFRLMDWYYNTAANGLSLFNFNELVDIFRSQEYEPSHIAKFDCVKANNKMDAYRGGKSEEGDKEDDEDSVNGEDSANTANGEEALASTTLPLSCYSGWHNGFIDIPLPRAGFKQSEDSAVTFRVEDICYRKALSVIQDDFTDTSFYSVHLKPFKQFWQPEPDAPIQRIYSEAFTSDKMLEMERDVRSRTPADCKHEVVVVAIMQYSDSTVLSHFGDRSIWPGYISFGNMSKYRRSNPSMFAMNHVVYVPKIPDSFKHTYKDLFDHAATDEVLRFVKRELIQLVWALILLDPSFVDAYLNGKLEQCADGIVRLLFPRLFAHSADYVEKVLLASIKFLSKFPCTHCMIQKSKIHWLGTLNDRHRRNQKREDTDDRRERIELVREWIFEDGYSLTNKDLVAQMEETSEQFDRNTFSELLHPVGDNFYDVIVVDTMHELAGLIENIFKQCNRLIFAEDKRNLEILNERFRKVPTFDNGTIRRFVNNVTLMKKFAFRDFEDVMQCSIACFEGLLPEPHNEVVLDLLWDFNVLMAYASLGMHTDSTVASLDSTITQYGMSLRRFVTVTCASYETREIPEEAEKRRNAEARREEKRLKTGKTVEETGNQKEA